METAEHRPPGLEDAEASPSMIHAPTEQRMDEVPEGRIFSLNSRKLVLE